MDSDGHFCRFQGFIVSATDGFHLYFCCAESSTKFIAVVDFVAAKAPRSHKDRQAHDKQFNQKHLIPANFNKFP
jgi:hypothetical protein